MRVTREHGFSLVEATIVLTVASILTAVAAPSASRALDRVRLARAVDDEEAIKTAMHNFSNDLQSYQGFNIDGSSTSATPVEMAVSDGDTPPVSASGDSRWICPVAVTPAVGCVITDFMERHFVTNNPFGDATKAYPLSGGNTWRGAYISAPIDPDPWGNRYAMNIKYLQAPANTSFDVIVVSAGPDETIDTQFQVNGIYPGGDDIIALVERDRNTQVP